VFHDGVWQLLRVSHAGNDSHTHLIAWQWTLAARGASPAAFDGRCIPAGGVALPSNTPSILGRRALPPGRLARLGATLDLHHGLPGIDRHVIVVNLGNGTSDGQVELPNLPSGSGWTFVDQLTGERYDWDRRDLEARGLYVRLEPGRSHVLSMEVSATPRA
jgi:hypothetical protein